MSNRKNKEGFVFKKYESKKQSPFERLFDIFKDIITYTSCQALWGPKRK